MYDVLPSGSPSLQELRHTLGVGKEQSKSFSWKFDGLSKPYNLVRVLEMRCTWFAGTDSAFKNGLVGSLAVVTVFGLQ